MNDLHIYRMRADNLQLTLRNEKLQDQLRRAEHERTATEVLRQIDNAVAAFKQLR